MNYQTNNTLTEEDVIEYLTNSGYDDKIVREAIKDTGSTDIDILVDHISKIEEHRASVKIKRVSNQTNNSEEARKETLRLIEENKRRIQEERRYKEELIRRTIEDRKNKEREEREREEREKSNQQEVKKVEGDCVINVRFPDSRSVTLYFNKEDKVSTVFDNIEEEYGAKSFKLFKARNTTPLVRTEEKLINNKLLYPKAVLFVEE